jgi:hypothetical protein
MVSSIVGASLTGKTVISASAALLFNPFSTTIYENVSVPLKSLLGVYVAEEPERVSVPFFVFLDMDMVDELEISSKVNVKAVSSFVVKDKLYANGALGSVGPSEQVHKKKGSSSNKIFLIKKYRLIQP